jgi:uncharacterized glyoxalase superfamily protein PhnB
MPTIETYLKEVSLLLRWHRGGDHSIGERLRRLERYRSLTDREALALDFTLDLAREIVAVEAGYPDWAALEAVTVGAAVPPPPPLGPPQLNSVVPILLVRDVAVCAGYFRDKLGFEIDFLHGVPPFYGAVSRDGVCLHLRFVGEPCFAEAARHEESLICASFEVTNVRALFHEFKTRGANFAQTLTPQAWGGTDFHIRDPDGNVVSFVAFGEG